MKQNAKTCSLREILQFAYQLRASMGPVDVGDLPQAMLLANEEDILGGGGIVNLPEWRREQLEKSLEMRFPESFYYAVERGVLPKFEGGAIKGERF